MSVTQSEFYEIDALYQTCFGETCIPTETQALWYLAQPSGVIALKLQGKIIGAMSYWYLSSSDYSEMLNGNLKEKNLNINSILNDSLRYAYISEIALLPEYQRKGYSQKLLQDWETQLRLENSETVSLSILALAYSEGGAKVLTKLGFRLIRSKEKNADKMPLYQLKQSF